MSLAVLRMTVATVRRCSVVLCGDGDSYGGGGGGGVSGVRSTLARALERAERSRNVRVRSVLFIRALKRETHSRSNLSAFGLRARLSVLASRGSRLFSRGSKGEGGEKGIWN